MDVWEDLDNQIQEAHQEDLKQLFQFLRLLELRCNEIKDMIENDTWGIR